MEDQLPLIGIAIGLTVAIGIGVWINSLASKNESVFSEPDRKKKNEPSLLTDCNDGFKDLLVAYVNLFTIPAAGITKITESGLYKWIAGNK
jgi:hypothetical protein